MCLSCLVFITSLCKLASLEPEARISLEQPLNKGRRNDEARSRRAAGQSAGSAQPPLSEVALAFRMMARGLNREGHHMSPRWRRHFLRDVGG